MTPTLHADDDSKILEAIKGFFETDDDWQHEELIGEIQSDQAYDPARLTALLHQVDVFMDLKPGKTHSLASEVGHGHRRGMHLRLPKKYTKDRAWPLVYALHASGGSGPSAIHRLERDLGKKIEDYIVLAPTHYRQTSLDAPPPFTQDHPEMLRDIRTAVNIDSNRIYAVGYSLGGYTSWALALVHPDHLAAAVPMASAFVPDDVEGLWQEITPNFRYVPVLHVWGDRDSLHVPGFESRYPGSGSMSSINKRFSKFLEQSDANVVDQRIPGAGHGGARPPRGLLLEFLNKTRVVYPKEVRHRFRHLHQASAYWLEGHAWQGKQWGAGVKIPRHKGSYQKALGEIFIPLLGALDGKIEGQKLTVHRNHISDMTVWIGDGMIDWSQPIELVVNGKTVYRGPVERDLGVALAQAKRSRDYERIRWAGLRVNAKGKVQKVKPYTEFPPLVP